MSIVPALRLVGLWLTCPPTTASRGPAAARVISRACAPRSSGCRTAVRDPAGHRTCTRERTLCRQRFAALSGTWSRIGSRWSRSCPAGSRSVWRRNGEGGSEPSLCPDDSMKDYGRQPSRDHERVAAARHAGAEHSFGRRRCQLAPPVAPGAGEGGSSAADGRAVLLGPTGRAGGCRDGERAPVVAPLDIEALASRGTVALVPRSLPDLAGGRDDRRRARGGGRRARLAALAALVTWWWPNSASTRLSATVAVACRARHQRPAQVEHRAPVEVTGRRLL
jgi:hypothetical protein